LLCFIITKILRIDHNTDGGRNQSLFRRCPAKEQPEEECGMKRALSGDPALKSIDKIMNML
jgi:hypothetical protein